MRTPEASAKAEPARKPAAAHPQGLEELKRLRREHIEQLAHAAAHDHAGVDRLVARLQSLSAAIDAIEKAGAKAGARRLAVAIVGAAVLLTGTLLLLHRPSTEILVDAKSSSIAFTVADSFAPLRDVPPVDSVELTGLAGIQEEGSSPEIAGSPDEELHLRLKTAAASKNPGSIGFDSLVVPAGTAVEITRTETAKTIELRVHCPPGASPPLDLDVTGDLAIEIEGREQRKANFQAPVRITAIPAGDVQLVVTFRSPEIAFPSPVRVESILWSRDARTGTGHPGAAREQSTLLSGKLSLEEFKSRSITLRNGEPLHLGGASGRIRQLRSDGQALSCQFDGAARELSIGEGSRRQNLMPTWLEWIRQRDALVQFWALAAYLAGLGLAIGRWWKESV